MMKMLIQIDEEKVLTEGKYDLKDMWRLIDEKFSAACTRELQPDGSVLYVGDPAKDYYAVFQIAATFLKRQKWFAEHCRKWLWYENDEENDVSDDYYEINVLDRQRSRNALFAGV